MRIGTDRFGVAWIFAGLAIMAAPVQALVVEVDGVTITRLSDAVAMCYASDDDGEDVINITAARLTAPDVQIELTKPITINGDPDNNGSCEILVDIAGIAEATNVGVTNKAYLEITAPGDVSINNLRLHPATDGDLYAGGGNIVMGILCAKPPLATDVGNYTFTNVEISGTDINNNNAFVPPDTGADLYNTAGYLKWSGRSGTNNGQIRNFGLFQLNSSGGDGVYNTVLDNCKAAMTFGSAMNMLAESGTHQVLSGLYGHCARDGIHVASPGTTLKGTQDNRLRIVRTTNIDGANSHGIEVQSTAVVDLIEYVDSRGMNSVNNLTMGGIVETVRYLRAMGKFSPESGRNHTVWISGDSAEIGSIEHITVWANAHGSFGRAPIGIAGGVINPIQFTNCIFTSDAVAYTDPEPGINAGTLFDDSAVEDVFTNCAFPTDGVLGETLDTFPILGPGSWSIMNSINVSPLYILSADDYDWSDAQGSGDLSNGAGNANVLRPSNPDYGTAATENGPLVGGAGPATASVGPDVWMLM